MSPPERKQYWKVWKTNKRVTDPSFVESEKLARAAWQTKNKLHVERCKAFAKANYDEFIKFNG